jgi:hypothetical protein
VTLRWPIAAILGMVPVALVAAVAASTHHRPPTATWTAERSFLSISSSEPGQTGAESDRVRSGCASLPRAAAAVVQRCYLTADMLQALEAIHGCANGSHGGALRACLTASLGWFGASLRSGAALDRTIGAALAPVGCRQAIVLADAHAGTAAAASDGLRQALAAPPAEVRVAMERWQAALAALARDDAASRVRALRVCRP